MSEIVYLGLGTNVGDRAANLDQAVDRLEEVMKVLGRSQIYQTRPWGYQEQPDFLNQVVAGETDLLPQVLLAELKRIEISLGREPTFHYGPRKIDLDILFFGDKVITQENLVIPHPHLHERAFVLVPLAEIAGKFRHPVLGVTVLEMLQRVDREGVTLFHSDGMESPGDGPVD